MDPAPHFPAEIERSEPRTHPVARILLAEDNPIASDLIAMMVRRLGYGIDRVADGLDAVVAIERAATRGRPYTLLLLDTVMPGLTGPEVARRIRTGGVTQAALAIVALTAASDPAEVRDYHEAGMQGHLAKPVSLAKLAACIETWAPRAVVARPCGAYPPAPDLRRRYEQRKSEVIAHFEKACAAKEYHPGLTAELRDHLHRLAGTAGSFGEGSLSDAAARGEALLIGALPCDVRRAVERSYALLKAAA